MPGYDRLSLRDTVADISQQHLSKACRECPARLDAAPDHTVPYGTVLSRDAIRRRFRGKCLATIGVVPPEGAGEIRNTIWPTSTIVLRRHPRPRSLNIVDGKDAREQWLGASGSLF